MLWITTQHTNCDFFPLHSYNLHMLVSVSTVSYGPHLCLLYIAFLAPYP